MAPIMQPKSTVSTVKAIRKSSRNHAALVLFGRAVVTTLSVTSAALGFIAGARMQGSNYDPYSYATGVGALFAAACAVIAFMLMRRRVAAEKMHALEATRRGNVRPQLGAARGGRARAQPARRAR